MSVEVMTQVWKSSLPDHQQHVLLALADHAHDDGTHVYPTVGYTAWKCNLSESTVRRVLRQLERGNAKKGIKPLLQAVIRSPGRRPTVYRILLENIPMKAAFRPNPVNLTGSNPVTVTGLEEDENEPGQSDWVNPVKSNTNPVKSTGSTRSSFDRATIMESPKKQKENHQAPTPQKKNTEQSRADADGRFLEWQREQERREGLALADYKALHAKLQKFDAKHSYRQRQLDRKAAEREQKGSAAV